MTDSVPEPADDESKLIPVAEMMVERLVKANSPRKWTVRVLGIVCVAMLAVIGFTANGYFTNKDTATTLRQQSITNCENNNTFRMSQVDIWEKNYALQAQESKATATLLTQLINVLANGNQAEIANIDAILKQSGSASASEITTFLNYIKARDAPKNCLALYEP